MADPDRSDHFVGKRIGGVLVTVILVNVLLRLAPLREVDLASISFPDLPAWVDEVVAWLHTVVKVKNWLLIAVVVVVVGVAIDRRRLTPSRRADR
jgi:hypothetical protein